METTQTTWKDRIKHVADRFRAWIDGIYSDKRKTFLFLALFVFTVLFTIDMLIILVRNSFYTNFSDDILQYYNIMNDFITQVKEGTISFFNLNNYLGASFFSDIYYVPLDVFTLITFVLSYVMPIEIAYSATELIKIFAGVMMLALFLSMQGKKNRTIFWMGIVYFISGGTVSFMAFPAFTSLAFYLPLGLVLIELFFRKIRWTLPLYAFLLIFYDFYLGYMALAFVSIMFIVEYFKRPGFKFFPFLRDGAFFLGLLLLGVVMSMVILAPSILFVLDDTYRTSGSFAGWTITILGHSLKLFPPDIYIRVLAKIFTEQKPIGFYGFQNNYATEHFSLYITVVGFVFMSYIYFMKGRVARVYKILIPVSLLMILFPIFSFVFSGTTDVPYTRWINVYPLVEVLILAHVFDEYGFEKVKMKWLSIPIGILMALDGFLIYYYIKKLSADGYYVSRDVLTADTVLMCVAALFMLLILVFGWLKQFRFIRWIFWVEFVVGLAYIYSGPFAIPNKITLYNDEASINEFLNENLPSNEFFRVYVDLNRFNVEKVNFNRMTTFPTNTDIFHSWTDAETNAIGYLLFGEYEYQTKSKLDVEAIYLNQFLGYKYLLLNASYEYYLPSDYYQLIAANSQYLLYEIKDAEPFQVYESYMTYDDFRTFGARFTKIAMQKLLLMTALLDPDTCDVSTLNLEPYTPETATGYKSIQSYQTNANATEVLTQGVTDATVRDFYKYDDADWKIGFDIGAIYIKSTSMSLDAYGEVFMEFEDGSRSSCQIQGTTDHQVKCEFWTEPTAIYFEKTTIFNEPMPLQYRLERAIGGAAYLVYDLSNIDFTAEQGMLYFQFINSLKFESIFGVDANGDQTEGFNGYYYFDSPPERLYVFKTSDMYGQANLFALPLKYVYDDLSDYGTYAQDSTLAADQTMSIAHGVIHLSYTRVSETTNDQLVVVPVAYSEEWKITSGQDYQTLAASGGFLGILIPDGVNQIDITLRFEPKGLKEGALASLAGFAVYAGIFLPAWLKKKRKNQIESVESNADEENIDHRPLV